MSLSQKTFNYSLYKMNGDTISGEASKPFTLSELQSFVEGRIEIIPIVNPINRKCLQYYVVSEDGVYRFSHNPQFPQFHGPVLIVDKQLVK